jgi:uncharacterized integral membrane protein
VYVFVCGYNEEVNKQHHDYHTTNTITILILIIIIIIIIINSDG